MTQKNIAMSELKRNPHQARLLSERTSQAVHVWKYWQEEILVCLAPPVYQSLLQENQALKVKLLHQETSKKNGGSTNGY
ncbi:hypothetical protein RyT2_21550 [Pseudolactococcus yaeyamensis]